MRSAAPAVASRDEARVSLISGNPQVPLLKHRCPLPETLAVINDHGSAHERRSYPESFPKAHLVSPTPSRY